MKIDDNKFFQSLSAGVISRTTVKVGYSTMCIALGQISSKGNLQNETVCGYKQRIKYIFQYLREEYGVDCIDRGIEVRMMEINCTFRIKEPFYKYHRVLQLMMYNLPSRYSKVSSISKKDAKKDCLEAETFYYGNKSMQIKIYDKRQQLLQKTGYDICDPVMRIEFVLKTSRKVKEVFHTNLLSDISDEKIENYFIKQFRKLFEKPFRSWQINNRKCLRALIGKHKQNSRNQWQQNLLGELRNQEQKNHVPFLLDIDDLLKEIKALDIHRHYKKVEKSILAKCSPDDVFLQRDTEKAEEIISKIYVSCSDNKHAITVLSA